MSPELQEKLFKKYPKIFKKNVPAQHPFDQRGIECEDGWFYLIDMLCSDIQKEVDDNNSPQPEFVQVKEKFSALRIYANNTNKDINKLIDNAEELSMKICEYCGSGDNVTQNKDGWIKTLCDKCRRNS